jgi:hypothetical protein
MIDPVTADAVSGSGVIKPGHAGSRDGQIAKAKGLALREKPTLGRLRLEHWREARPLSAAPHFISIARGNTIR